jgi:hypothetical protein
LHAVVSAPACATSLLAQFPVGSRHSCLWGVAWPSGAAQGYGAALGVILPRRSFSHAFDPQPATQITYQPSHAQKIVQQPQPRPCWHTRYACASTHTSPPFSSHATPPPPRMQANAVEYFEIDTSRPLRQQLAGKVVVEHPTFLVLLPRERTQYKLIPATAAAAPSANPAAAAAPSAARDSGPRSPAASRADSASEAAGAVATPARAAAEPVAAPSPAAVVGGVAADDRTGVGRQGPAPGPPPAAAAASAGVS